MKKTYQRPTLRQHGAVEQLTLGMMGSYSDMMGAMMMNAMATPGDPD